MGIYDLDENTRKLRGRMKEFIDGEVIPAEAVLAKEDAAARQEMDRLKRRSGDAGTTRTTSRR